MKNNYIYDIRTARKNIKDYFNTDNIELKSKLLNNIFLRHQLDENLVNSIESIIKNYSKDQINFALNIKNYHYNELNFFLNIKDSAMIKKMNFFEILEWINSKDGIYYAISNNGTKGMAYLEKPTKKQAKYQRQKNSKRIIFLSFRDWKQYPVNENELK